MRYSSFGDLLISPAGFFEKISYLFCRQITCSVLQITSCNLVMRETKTPRVQKKGEAKKNQRLKALISNKAKKSVNESVT